MQANIKQVRSCTKEVHGVKSRHPYTTRIVIMPATKTKEGGVGMIQPIDPAITNITISSTHRPTKGEVEFGTLLQKELSWEAQDRANRKNRDPMLC